MTVWKRLVRQPQELFLRRALFQIHLWTGIAVGLYLVAICLSGAVLVYRVELSNRFQAKPIYVGGTGTPLSKEALTEAAKRAYPDYKVAQIWDVTQPDQAVEIYLERGEARIQRLFHPFTGADLGNSVPIGFRFITWLLDLHDNLLYGETGRSINGIGALFLMVLALTGAIIWWPGSQRWRRSLTIDVKANWKRLNWSLHSALGFWCFAFILMWGITGLYLSFPQTFYDFFEYFEPSEDYEPDTLISDQILFWLTYTHFGRFARRMPGCTPTCDSTLKAVWAVVAIVPPVLFVTGALMWWNRVLRHGARQSGVEIGRRLRSGRAELTASERAEGARRVSGT